MPNLPVPATIRNYLIAFDATAIAITDDGRIVITANPAGHQRAWWTAKPNAKQLRKEARKDGDVEAAARRLGVAITPHAAAVTKAQRALRLLDDVLTRAKAQGTLQEFNRMYAARRAAALAAGRSYMPYHLAQRRLKQALCAAIASGVHGREAVLAVSRAFE